VAIRRWAVVREAQLREAGRLAGEAVGGVVTTVADVQRAIGRRLRAALPPGGQAVADVQAGISELVYASIGRGVRAVSGVAAELLVRGSHGAPALTETLAGGFAVSAVNGIWGDTIADHHPALAVPPVIRVQCRDLLLHRIRVSDDVPHPTGRVVVFIHGLTENDRSWWPGRADVATGTAATFGERLRADLGYSPVYFHYNSGLRVDDNGRALAEALDRLLGVWPVPIERIALVGHSMGGLVARSACRYGALEEHRWVADLATVVTLGTPHLGAPLEKIVHAAERVLGALPESAPLARVLASRSHGVRDLRFGAPGADGLLDHVTYCFASASIIRDDDHPVGRLLGDGLVRRSSADATGRTRRAALVPRHRAHFPGLHHFSLLNHPAVYDQVRDWLG
jgi:pimeloyl-ACP methyl ester carboxylesterase